MNAIPLPHGAVQRRSGMQHITTVPNGSRLFPVPGGVVCVAPGQPPLLIRADGLNEPVVTTLTGWFQQVTPPPMEIGDGSQPCRFPVEPLVVMLADDSMIPIPRTMPAPGACGHGDDGLIPDDTACTLDEWNAKIDALLEECRDHGADV